MKRSSFLLLAWWGLLSPVYADGGTVRCSLRQGPYQITIFSDPTPPRVGIVDVSVLVQDCAGNPVPDVQVWIAARHTGQDAKAILHHATSDIATNKLLRMAEFNLGLAGRWQFRVTMDRGKESEEMAFDLDVAPPLPHWLSLAGWFAWLVVPIGLFIVHQMLVRRKSESNGTTSSQ